MSKFMEFFASSLVDTGVYLNFHPKRNQVVAEATREMPSAELMRMGLLVGTQPDETAGYYFAALADRAACGDTEARVTIRIFISRRPGSVSTAATQSGLDGLEELYSAIQQCCTSGLEALVRSIIKRAEREVDQVDSDLLWELVKRILRKHDNLTELLINSTLSRAA